MPLYRLLLLLPALCALASCADNFVPKSEPSFYRNLAQPGAQLDAAAAASMISGYRTNNGLPVVALDADLMRLAQAQAEVMAKRPVSAVIVGVFVEAAIFVAAVIVTETQQVLVVDQPVAEAFAGDLLERLTGRGKDGFETEAAGRTADGDVDIARFQFDQASTATGPVRRGPRARAPTACAS